MPVDQKERFMITGVSPANTHDPRELRWLQVKPRKSARWKGAATVHEQKKGRSSPTMWCSAWWHHTTQSRASQGRAVPQRCPLHSIGSPCPLTHPLTPVGTAQGPSPRSGWELQGRELAGRLGEMIPLISSGVKSPGIEKRLALQGSILQFMWQFSSLLISALSKILESISSDWQSSGIYE